MLGELPHGPVHPQRSSVPSPTLLTLPPCPPVPSASFPKVTLASLPQDDHKLSLDELGRKYQVDLSKVSRPKRWEKRIKWENLETLMHCSYNYSEETGPEIRELPMVTWVVGGRVKTRIWSPASYPVFPGSQDSLEHGPLGRALSFTKPVTHNLSQSRHTWE